MNPRLQFPSPARRTEGASEDRRLGDALAGSEWRLLAVECVPEDARHLEACGLLPGQSLRVLHNDHRGTVVVEVAGLALVLGRRYTYRLRLTPRPPAGRLIPWG
jgi:Fe2+ transport system protein FeoA